MANFAGWNRRSAVSDGKSRLSRRGEEVETYRSGILAVVALLLLPTGDLGLAARLPYLPSLSDPLLPGTRSLGNGALMKEAALLIEQLRSEVLRLERLKTPEDQHAAGYAEAQADIRRALGID